MRITLGTFLVCGALCVACGCAQRTQTITVAPSHDELPNLTELEPISPVTAVAEGRTDEPRIQLVAPFKEPELTPEEQAVLGQRREVIKLLLYQVPDYRPGTRVGTWFGGVRTLAHGRGGADAVSGGSTSGVSTTGARGGAVSGVDTFGSHIAATGTAAQGAGQSGPESGLRVDVDRPSQVAGHKTRRDR